MKNKIDDLYNTLHKLTKEWNNLNILLGNQIDSYKKFGLGYELKNNVKYFSIHDMLIRP